MYFFESDDSAERCAGDALRDDIELHCFVAIPIAGVLELRADFERLAGLQRLGRKLARCVLKARVTEAVAERIERYAGEVAIGAILHSVVVERRKLIGACVEGD